MNLNKLIEKKPLNEFLEKVGRCREKCRTDGGIKCLDNLGFVLVDRMLQSEFNEFEQGDVYEDIRRHTHQSLRHQNFTF